MIAMTFSETSMYYYMANENYELASKYKDVFVIDEHARSDEERWKRFPSKHKNVHYWVELECGIAIGLNENPGRGMSFPIIRTKK
jgi:hypothetical protein